jgi:hypothetical protein
MSARHRIEKILQNPRIWQAGRGGSSRQFEPTGFAALDAALSGGWPVGQLIELLVDPYGIGELRLLMPALTTLAGISSRAAAGRGPLRGRESGLAGTARPGAGKWIMLIAPPYMPYAPAFAHQGLNTACLLVAHCDRQADALWAVEQAVRSQTCGVVLAWVASADERSLRRLQLAAEACSTGLLVLFRPLRVESQRSPAALRIRLQPGATGELDLHVFKNRGGRPQTVTIGLGDGSRSVG